VITTHALTKRYGDSFAVDGLDLDVQPGRVTGFLGPNGAGKSTTMRLVLGLERATSGTATIDGKPYRDLPSPLRVVGSMLDANAVDPKRSAANHLRWLARSNRIDRRRIDASLGLVGLSGVAGNRVGTFSLGMRQRLGIAAAMLGDPATLILDEPINGLDPDGIQWLRRFLRELADQGRTVFLSSHLMSEMALTADHVLVIGAGRLLADASIHDMLQNQAASIVQVRASARGDELKRLVGLDGAATRHDGEHLVVEGLSATRVGEIAAAHAIPLAELTAREASLESVFLDLTRTTARHQAAASHLATAGAQP
jgi:ABC-2 type transport system ATP-binding protein